jgi:hypothetical protein
MRELLSWVGCAPLHLLHGRLLCQSWSTRNEPAPMHRDECCRSRRSTCVALGRYPRPKNPRLQPASSISTVRACPRRMGGRSSTGRRSSPACGGLACIASWRGTRPRLPTMPLRPIGPRVGIRALLGAAGTSATCSIGYGMSRRFHCWLTPSGSGHRTCKVPDIQRLAAPPNGSNRRLH